MTDVRTDRAEPDARPDVPTPRPVTLDSRSLPRQAPWVAFIIGAVIAAGLSALLGFSIAGFLVMTAVAGALVLTAASVAVEGRRRATDRFVTTLVATAFLLALAPLVSLLYVVITRGAARFDGQFFSFSMVGVIGAGGGAFHALIGTLVITALATLISVPIGLMTGVYLVEYGRGQLARWITFLVDVMTGIPSIVAGLFAVALFTLFFGPGIRLGIMGSVALAVLMIPLVVRSTEEMLKLVPNELREASYALGVPKWLTIVKVVLRTALGGIATGVTLAIARVLGETAPLLLTTGLTSGTNWNPFEGRMASLPVFSWYQYVQPGIPPAPFIDRAWTAALILIILVMAFNLLARGISKAFAPKSR